MIYPDDHWKIFWDLLISLVLLISCFSTPFNLAFPELEENIRWYRIASWTIDVLFLIDIIVNFFSAYQN
jgi:hypothetical protein